MVKKSLKICQLYQKDMNIYGDTGNVLALKHRAEQRGIVVTTTTCEVGEKLETDIDILVGGGGQDSGQSRVEQDLLKKGKLLRGMADDGVPMVLICGLYQLFGHRFVTQEGEDIKGIGLFDLETIASSDRMIGNIVITSQFGQMVGFENHSGKTYLKGAASLGDVVSGAGNNGETGEEGAIYNNAFGTYMHGPVLPKNPRFADHLLLKSLQRKFGISILDPIDDTEELFAAEMASKLPR